MNSRILGYFPEYVFFSLIFFRVNGKKILSIINKHLLVPHRKRASFRHRVYRDTNIKAINEGIEFIPMPPLDRFKFFHL